MNIRILFLTIIAIIAFISCKKNYTCICTSTSDASITYEDPIKDTKLKAKSTCEARSNVSAYSTTKCVIK